MWLDALPPILYLSLEIIHESCRQRRYLARCLLLTQGLQCTQLHFCIALLPVLLLPGSCCSTSSLLRAEVVLCGVLSRAQLWDVPCTGDAAVGALTHSLSARRGKVKNDLCGMR